MATNEKIKIIDHPDQLKELKPGTQYILRSDMDRPVEPMDGDVVIGGEDEFAEYRNGTAADFAKKHKKIIVVGLLTDLGVKFNKRTKELVLWELFLTKIKGV